MCLERRTLPLDRRKGIRNGKPAVVMKMSSDTNRTKSLYHRADNRFNLIRRFAAVGVAEHKRLASRLDRRRKAVKRISRILLVAVKKVLGVKKDLFPLFDKIFDRIPYHFYVLFPRRHKHVLNLEGAAFTNDSDYLCSRRDESAQRNVLFAGFVLFSR